MSRPQLAGLLVACVCVVLCVRVPFAQNAQQAPAPTGLIFGRVLDGVTRKPVAAAGVQISGAGSRGNPLPTILTDTEGRFLFSGLPRGRYGLQAIKTGYLGGEYGRRRLDSSSGSRLELGDDERIGNVELLVWKFAAISGTVIDEAGEPVAGLMVSVFRHDFVAGRSMWRNVNVMSTEQVTDDRGAFRVPSLAPGEYVVGVRTAISSVSQAAADVLGSRSSPGRTELMQDLTDQFDPRPRSNSRTIHGTLVNLALAGTLAPRVAGRDVWMYPPVYYPSARAFTAATPITISPGETRTGIDIQVRPIKAVTVSGVVTGADKPAALAVVHLDEATSPGAGFEAATTVADAGGAFTFPVVANGRYVIRVRRVPRAPADESGRTVIQTGSTMLSMSNESAAPRPAVGPSDWASVPITVADVDITDLHLTLRPALRLAGTLVFEGDAQKPSGSELSSVRLRVSPADGGATRPESTIQNLNTSGQFDIPDLPQGRYELDLLGAPRGWSLKSIIVDGKDITDFPLDLRGDTSGIAMMLTSKPAGITGTVRDARGNPTGDAEVLVFSTDRRLWTESAMPARRLRNLQPARTGVIAMTSLPAGEYFVIAVAPDAPSGWPRPDALDRLASQATRIRLADGETKTIDLALTVLR